MILRCSLFSSFAEDLCSVCVPCTLLNKGAGVCRPNKWILAFKLWHLCGLGGVWVALLCSLGSTFVDGLFSVCPLCDLYAGWRGGGSVPEELDMLVSSYDNYASCGASEWSSAVLSVPVLRDI